VRIPLNLETVAGYSRTYHMSNEHETGIVSAVMGLTPYDSMLGPGFKYGLVQKYHTLSFDGVLPTRRVDRIEKEAKERTEEEQRRAMINQEAKTLILLGIIAGTGVASELLEAGIDQIHNAKIKEVVKRVRDGEISLNIETLLMNRRSEEAQKALEDAKTMRSIKSENHCVHFEDWDGLILTDDYLQMPLETPIFTLSGETVFSPLARFGSNTAINIAKYNVETNSLEFHAQAYAQYHLYTDIDDDSTSSGLWLAPIQNDYAADATDGRLDSRYAPEYVRSIPMNLLVTAYDALPMDYSLFDRTDTCTEEERSTLEPYYDWITTELDETPIYGLDFLSSAAEYVGITYASVKSLTCGSSFMKADDGSNHTGSDWVVFIMWMHFLLEWNEEERLEQTSAVYWDNWISLFEDEDKIQ